MKRILYLTSIAAPYRIQFFDELGRSMDVTVLFSDRRDAQYQRSEDWYAGSEGRFRQVYLEKRLLTAGAGDLRTDVIPWLKQKWDAIVICGYSSPTAMLAIFYLRMRRIPFYMEVDGGLIREDSGPKFLLKKFLISSADQWIGSGEYTTRYLVHYGAVRERVHTYPFTSLWERELLKEVPTPEQKRQLRRRLGLEEEKLVLYVGRFSPEKGMDDLLQAAEKLEQDTGVCFVGGEPGEDHLAYCREHLLTHVHFVGFKKKEELIPYYQAADLLVLPTRSDVWGLVINEAMAQGLPVITTDQCVAGLELVEEGVNGSIVPVGDQEALEQAILRVLRSDYRAMGRAALETIRPYTMENMTRVHADIFEGKEG